MEGLVEDRQVMADRRGSERVDDDDRLPSAVDSPAQQRSEVVGALDLGRLVARDLKVLLTEHGRRRGLGDPVSVHSARLKDDGRRGRRGRRHRGATGGHGGHGGDGQAKLTAAAIRREMRMCPPGFSTGAALPACRDPTLTPRTIPLPASQVDMRLLTWLSHVRIRQVPGCPF